MEPIIVIKKIKGDNDMRRQSTAAHALLAEVTGSQVRHSETGRPIVDAPVDASITHKHDLICVGVVPDPYRIGVDVEYLAEDIRHDLFVGSVVAQEELACAEAYCAIHGLPASAAIPLLWSVKEAFVKCLDRPFEPRTICIDNINADGLITFAYASQVVRDRALVLHSAKIATVDGYVHAYVIMREE